MAVINGGRVSSVFSTDTEFQFRLSSPSLVYSQFHQFSNSGLIETSKRVLAEYFLTLVFIVKQAHVIAT